MFIGLGGTILKNTKNRDNTIGKNKKLFLNETIEKFSISKIWFKLIDSKNLYGYESKQNFYHLTNLEIFKKLKDL